ncbi:MAG: ATP-binding protein [Olsenella sp.]|jgi:DNA replication protein DnaC|nr:ATP-binding protein [Olsenella sp.]
MPEAFARPEWDDARIRGRARKAGPSCAEVVDRIFARARLKEQAHNPALSVPRLSKKYGGERLEAACAHALPRLTSPRHRHIKAILDSSLEGGRRTAPPRAAAQGHRAACAGPTTTGAGAVAAIDEETRRRLREMSMGEMVDALGLQEADRTCVGVPFDERVRTMVDHAHEAKRASSVRRLTQRARLRFPDAGPGEMTCEGRGTDGVLAREAPASQFMGRAANAIAEGCTGTGKSCLACCMAKQACRMRRGARHVRLPDLLTGRDELAATERPDAKILGKYARYELLVIGEWLTEDVGDVAIRFLLELVGRRHVDRPTVPCTQYSPADWHGRLGGGVQADAMIDRLVHGAVRIDLGDVNVRRPLAEKK